jgi:hypothetical protein
VVAAVHWGSGRGSRMGWGAARRWCQPFIGVVGRFGGEIFSGGEVAGGARAAS